MECHETHLAASRLFSLLSVSGSNNFTLVIARPPLRYTAVVVDDSLATWGKGGYKGLDAGISPASNLLLLGITR